MYLLLDTHTLIWHRDGNKRLSAAAFRMLANPANRVFISIATLWEMAIKRSLKKLNTEKAPLEYLAFYQSRGAKLLTITPEHAKAVESLPFHHRDPFDRMLIAQAQVEGLTILTVDEIFSQYDIQTKW